MSASPLVDNKIAEPRILSVFVASGLFYFSGAAALIYEILWMKELSLLFGNSVQAAAATLAAFFTGIAAGNAYWGHRAAKLARPLLTYGYLELCVTLSAALYFAVYFGYDLVYPVLFNLFESTPMVFTLAKFILALLLFFPAAFFMGGTLPVMTQYMVRSHNTLGKRASLLYAINTFGAASGALAAGFYLPQKFGIDNSYLLAMAATLMVGLIAILLGRHHSHNIVNPGQTTDQSTMDQHSDAKNTHNSVHKSKQDNASLSPFTLFVLAGLSGFASLALQVLWIRMFSQVLHNSVYSYSAILSVFLLALALGGSIARELARRQIVERWILPLLLTLTAVLVAASPLVFHYMTDGGAYVGGDEDFVTYLGHIFALTAVVIGVPTVVIGILLPYLFKFSESRDATPGKAVGRLVSINTVGAIIGSICAGFLLLDWFGLWSSLKVVATLYVVAAILISIERPLRLPAIMLVPVLGVVSLFTVLDTGKLPVVRIDSSNDKETLLKVWEGSDATVAVVRRNGYLRTKLNNWYTLGSTGDMATQQIQTHLPMLLHPNPKQVFYLGLGTGITAGTALNYKIENIVVTEIAPSAIQASAEYFNDYTNGLFEDARVEIIPEDGRNVLRGSPKIYDLIISDLFIPWKAGTGTLYSIEHYQTARQRLNSDGMYVQWLPLYQLTQEEFTIIVRSMLEVFPTVSQWRGNFWGDKAVVALIGHKGNSNLDPNSPLMSTSRLALDVASDAKPDRLPLIAHYAGSLTVDDSWFLDAKLNTDSHPIIEYIAPINHRLEKAGKAEWLLGQKMLEYVAPYLSKDSLRSDPYLSNIDSVWYDVIAAGYYLQASFVLRDSKNNASQEAKANSELLLKRASSKLSRMSSSSL